MQQDLQQKKGLVEGVFNKVFDRYDLMNDFMSLGIHRIWKKDLIIYFLPIVILESLNSPVLEVL